MLKPSDQAEVLEALATEIRELLKQTPTHQQLIAVPYGIEEGLHETFEGFLADGVALGGLWKNRRPRAELARMAERLAEKAGELGRERTAGDDDSLPDSPADGHVPAADIYEEFPDVASSLGKLLRILGENPGIRRQGPSPLRITVHIDDFARFAARVRGAPAPD